MSYHYTFDDNAVYGTQDINRITAGFVTAGVADCFEQDGTPYHLSQTDPETGAVIFKTGVREDDTSLQVEKAAEDGFVVIQPGKAFMGDGAVFEVFLPETAEENSAPVTDVKLAYAPGVKNYVYIKNDFVFSNSYYPVCAQTAPSGDFVPLAEIEADGTVTDKRTYAAGKLPSAESSYGRKEIEVSLNLTPVPTLSSNQEYYRYFTAEGTAAIDVESNRRFVYVYSGDTAGIYDLAGGTYNSLRMDRGYVTGSDSKTLYLHNDGAGDYASAVVSVSQNKLIFHVTYHPARELHPNTLEQDKVIPYRFTCVLI